MNKQAAILALLMTLTVPAVAEKMDLGKVVIENWSVVTASQKSITADGTPASQVRVNAKDGSFAAKADKIVVTKGASGYQTAKLTGRVWLKAAPQPGKVTTATSEIAFVDYATGQEAVLSGGVKITTTDPDLFVGPATVTGDKATINLRQNIGPDEARIRIESAPEKSRLEFTPKQPPAKPQPETTEQNK